MKNVLASLSKGWNMSTQRHFDNTPGYKDGRFTSLFQFRLSGHTAKWISSIHLPLDLAAHFNYMRTLCQWYPAVVCTHEPHRPFP